MNKPINRRKFIKLVGVGVITLPLVGVFSSPKHQADWTDSNYIGFWQHEPAKQMQFAIINDGVLSEKIDIEGNTHAKHSWYQVKISRLPRDKVESMRFYSDGIDENFYPDDLIRFKSDLNEMKPVW